MRIAAEELQAVDIWGSHDDAEAPPVSHTDLPPPRSQPPRFHVAEWACETGIGVPIPTGAMDFPSWNFTGHLGAECF